MDICSKAANDITLICLENSKAMLAMRLGCERGGEAEFQICSFGQKKAFGFELANSTNTIYHSLVPSGSFCADS